MKIFFILIIMALISGCSSVVTSTAALLVSLHSKKIESDSRRYKHIDKCLVKGRPGAFILAESIVNGQPIARDYQHILNPELHDRDPLPPHHLAYAFYLITERIGDTRAESRKEMLLPYFEKNEAKEIEEFIEYKYLKSYLTKCFSVPAQYKIHLKDRDLL
jgi:hypothetical protein